MRVVWLEGIHIFPFQVRFIFFIQKIHSARNICRNIIAGRETSTYVFLISKTFCLEY